jgi:mRNA-degrading endonuclease RelE of RelBE toxin-antitoxin system
MKIEFEQQVVEFLSSLGPAPRRALRQALRNLAQEKSDIRPLEAELDGFYRLRVGRCRVIFLYRSTRRRRQVRCVFAEHRTIIYEVFARHLHEYLEK